MSAGAPVRHAEPSAALAGDKGLKRNAIGYLSNLVIGVASTAPAYSLAATLGFIVAVPAIVIGIGSLLLGIPLMVLCSLKYREFFRRKPELAEDGALDVELQPVENRL